MVVFGNFVDVNAQLLHRQLHQTTNKLQLELLLEIDQSSSNLVVVEWCVCETYTNINIGMSGKIDGWLNVRPNKYVIVSGPR